MSATLQRSGRGDMVVRCSFARSLRSTPFEEGEAPPPHVQAAIDAVRGFGVEIELEPLSQVVTGEVHAVLEALLAAQKAGFAAGATKIVVSLKVDE